MPSYYYRLVDPSDVRDLGEQMAAWLAADNPKATQWAPLPPQPSPEHVWQNGEWVLPPPPPPPSSVSARQIRLWLVGHGITMADVDTAIESIEDATLREVTRIEWEFAPYVERVHPMVAALGAALGLTAAEIDQAFVEASVL